MSCPCRIRILIFLNLSCSHVPPYHISVAASMSVLLRSQSAPSAPSSHTSPPTLVPNPRFTLAPDQFHLYHRPHCMDFPHFDGVDAIGWLFWASQYFQFHPTTDNQLLLIAVVHMEGRTLPVVSMGFQQYLLSHLARICSSSGTTILAVGVQ